MHFDAAFVPLDPRQEAHYADGILYFLENVDCNAVFPMHYWEDASVIKRFITEDVYKRQDLDGPASEIIDYIGGRETMGFAEYTTAPAALCVKFTTMSFQEGALIEPMGVAMDLFKTADIHLGDDVLVFGLGPIGLMALQMAKKAGARKIYAADLSTAGKRAELAKKFGADEIIFTDKVDIKSYPFARGGVDKVLLTAPPALIETATHTLRCV